MLIVCEDQELIANEVFCHRSCYANYTHPDKLQRIQDATPPATDSATSAAEVQGSSEDAAFELLAKEIEDSINFSMAEVVKLDNLRKRYRFERAINTQ